MNDGLKTRIAAAQKGDRQALDALLRDNTPLVWSVARRFFGRGCEPEDLFQLGCIGLLKAIRDFDLSLGVELSTYAVPRIAGEMRRFLRDDGPVKVSRVLKERAALLRQAQSRLEAREGQSPRLSDLCRETGLSPEEAMEALNAPRDTDSLDAPLPGQERTLGEVLPAAAGEHRLLDSLALGEALSRLEPQLRQVILLRYMRDLTQQKIGQVMGLSQVQVSRLEKKARLLLKAALAE
ncbi:MAG: sigma-70 family RNA polymerase sigma factor [Clostridia bacterium]|nr:sigma-70 family RNA polymerase sigma factor [Clostridia bacterium]MBR6574715.1 sigma-70 family RNA polymerase sigma factor [Clostridia bacterium]